MNIRFARIMLTIVAVAIVMTVTFASIINKKEAEDEGNEEYGTMEVYEPISEGSSSLVSSVSNEIEDAGDTNTTDVVEETKEYNWFMSFRNFYEYAMSKQDKSYESDTDYISECLNKMFPDEEFPDRDLNSYYESLEHLDLDSAIVGDLVFFFDENNNAVHMGVKGYSNHMYDLKDGKVTYEYISDDGRDFAFARVVQVDYDEEEMAKEQEKTGYRHAELYAVEDDMDLSVFDDFKEQLLTQLNNKFSDTHPSMPIKCFYVLDIDTNAYDGRALNATVACGEYAKRYVVRYVYDVNRLYIL